ncbi:DUF3168 domain-containing protein [Agrobacterium sp. a22-2]|uniref:DUF3168 domain-containing protein n=1 Tax=Agrobacterium sp. a22-2 TaxID=2283840 RepID=UPI0014467247|nr:DUF3168 domain-containing protein [Agrobacterium sp. a22-2]NKN39616.1 DUF3168 domain-containing protein [Agrobacterium sp. a22-2]
MSAVNELLQAVHARLSGDAALTALIGTAGIHDRRLSKAALPTLVIGSIEARDYSTGTEMGCECLLSLEAWSASGRREAEEIAGLVRGLLDDADLALPSAVLVSLAHRKTVSRREVKTALFVAEMQFRAVLEVG